MGGGGSRGEMKVLLSGGNRLNMRNVYSNCKCAAAINYLRDKATNTWEFQHFAAQFFWHVAELAANFDICRHWKYTHTHTRSHTRTHSCRYSSTRVIFKEFSLSLCPSLSHWNSCVAHRSEATFQIVDFLADAGAASGQSHRQAWRCCVSNKNCHNTAVNFWLRLRLNQLRIISYAWK